MRTIALMLSTVGLIAGLLGMGVPKAAAVDECLYGASGSFNADSFPDLVVGVPESNAVDVFYSRTGPPTRYTAASLGLPGSASDEFGSAAFAADVNDDYCYDLVIGSPGANAGAGRVTIVNGSVDGLQVTGATVVESPDPSARFGAAISLNRGGTPATALLVGAPGYDDGAATDAGAIYAFPMTGSGLDSATRITQHTAGIDGESMPGDNFGGVLAENLAGLPNKDVDAATDAGAVVQLSFSSVHPVTVTGRSYTQNSPGVPGVPESGDHFGAALADSYNYVAVGVPGEDVGSIRDAGSVQLFVQHNADPLKVDRSITQGSAGIPGADEAGDQFGAAVVAGYFESKSYDWYEVWVGAPGENVGSIVDAGSVTRIQLAGRKLATSLTAGKGLPGKSERGDRLGATLAALDDAQESIEGSLSVLIGVPGEDRGSVVDSGWVVFADCWTSSGMKPYSLANTAHAGEKYGRVLGQG